MSKRKSKDKPKTISKMCGSRGTMPPPTVKDEVKKKKNDRHKVKQKLKRGDYDY